MRWMIFEHGAFTYALVEGLGLQGRCATAAKLNTYLKHRVPELAKTRQTPRMMLDPQEKGHLILMPKYAEKIDLEPLKKQQFQIQNDFAPFQRFTEILRIINFSWCKGFRAVKF